MRMRRQMSEGRPGGNVRKKKKDNLNNRMALVGVTMVVLSLAVAAHMGGIDRASADRSGSIREKNLAQVAKEEERAKQLEEYRVYVQTKQYIENSEGRSWGQTAMRSCSNRPIRIRLVVHHRMSGACHTGEQPRMCRKCRSFLFGLLCPFDKIFFSSLYIMALYRLGRDFLCLNGELYIEIWRMSTSTRQDV